MTKKNKQIHSIFRKIRTAETTEELTLADIARENRRKMEKSEEISEEASEDLTERLRQMANAPAPVVHKEGRQSDTDDENNT